MTAPTPIIRAAGEGDQRAFMGGGHHTWKLRQEQTGGALFLLEDVMTQGKCTPLHLHPEADETLFVLEGEILVRIGDDEQRVSAGGMTFTPRNTPHAFVVLSDFVRSLTIQTPGVGEGFYWDASDPAAADDTGERVDLARLQASAAANPRGVQILGPPPFEKVAR